MPNRLPAIARWKILDNLRRSLIPPSLVVLLVAAWTILPGSPALWTTLALLVIAFPAYTQLGRSVTNRLAGVPLREHFRAERDNILGGLRQAALSLVMLAHQTAVMLDAIGRTADPDAGHPAQSAAVGHRRSRRRAGDARRRASSGCGWRR